MNRTKKRANLPILLDPMIWVVGASMVLLVMVLTL